MMWRSMFSTLPLFVAMGVRHGYVICIWVAGTGYLVISTCRLLLIHQVRSN